MVSQTSVSDRWRREKRELGRAVLGRGGWSWRRTLDYTQKGNESRHIWLTPAPAAASKSLKNLEKIWGKKDIGN